MGVKQCLGDAITSLLSFRLCALDGSYKSLLNSPFSRSASIQVISFFLAPVSMLAVSFSNLTRNNCNDVCNIHVSFIDENHVICPTLSKRWITWRRNRNRRNKKCKAWTSRVEPRANRADLAGKFYEGGRHLQPRFYLIGLALTGGHRNLYDSLQWGDKKSRN